MAVCVVDSTDRRNRLPHGQQRPLAYHDPHVRRNPPQSARRRSARSWGPRQQAPRGPAALRQMPPLLRAAMPVRLHDAVLAPLGDCNGLRVTPVFYLLRSLHTHRTCTRFCAAEQLSCIAGDCAVQASRRQRTAACEIPMASCLHHACTCMTHACARAVSWYLLLRCWCTCVQVARQLGSSRDCG